MTETLKEMPVKELLSLYKRLEEILDKIAPESIYSKEFLDGLDEAQEDVEKRDLKEANTYEDFLNYEIKLLIPYPPNYSVSSQRTYSYKPLLC